MERLTDREYGETIGSLQIFRDLLTVDDAEFDAQIARLRIRREQIGTVPPADVISALAKLTTGCTPTTYGIEFRLIDASEAAA